MIIIATLWFSVFEGKEMLYGLFLMLYYIVVSIIGLIFISCYHFSLVYFSSRSISITALKKIGIILVLNVIFDIWRFCVLPTWPASIEFLKSAMIIMGFSILVVLSYELTLRLFKK